MGKQVSVWTFRVERYDPKTSSTLPPIQVVMVATVFDAGIRDGDEVEVFGNWKAGRPMRAKRVHIVRTGTTVKAKTASFFPPLLVALLLWAATLYLVFSGPWHNGSALVITLIAGFGAFAVTIIVLNQFVDKLRFR
jgi:hypothetical protein